MGFLKKPVTLDGITLLGGKAIQNGGSYTPNLFLYKLSEGYALALDYGNNRIRVIDRLDKEDALRSFGAIEKDEDFYREFGR